MPVTSKLKPIVDLPVWEFCRPMPAATTALSYFVADPTGRYLYYLVASAFYRYDTYTDSWIQLANPVTAPATVLSMTYSKTDGYYGAAISAGPGNNTIELAGLNGNALVGKRIKIYKGRGAGQIRTITAISDPKVVERGYNTNNAVNNSLIDIGTGIDAKIWEHNRYMNYQLRIIYSSGAGSIVKPIFNHSSNFIYPVGTQQGWQWGSVFPVNIAATGTTVTQYQIESNIATVDSPWTVRPDDTSHFVVLSDGIWLISSSSTAPFYTLQCYSVLTDTWYTKDIRFGQLLAALGTDVTIEKLKTSPTPALTGTVTSATNRTIADSTLSASRDSFKNFCVEITDGTGAGQRRTIIANTLSAFTFTRDWDVNPDATSKYEVKADDQKIYIFGNNSSTIYQYDIESDSLTTGTLFDYGVARSISVTLTSSSDATFNSASSITRNSNSVLSVTVGSGGTGYRANQSITITGGTTTCTLKITSVDSNGGVLGVEIVIPGAGYSVSSGNATTSLNSVGTGCTINIVTVGTTCSTTLDGFHRFKKGMMINIRGATPNEYNGTVQIIGTDRATGSIQTIYYLPVSTPSTATGTPLSANSSTSLVDFTKNWITNEHVGKTVILRNNTDGFIRRINSNTQNALTFASVGTAPANQITRYAICDSKCFGNEVSIGGQIGGGTTGFATSGTTTSLTDTTKTWPDNFWANKNPTGAGNIGRRIRFLAGTNAGTEVEILSSTSTTLSFSALPAAVDGTSLYQILDHHGTVSSGSTTTLVDISQNWQTNQLVGKRVRLVAGTGAGNEYTITANTQTTLTFAAATAPDSTTLYSILNMAPRSTGMGACFIRSSSDATLTNKYIYLFRGGATNEIARYNIVSQDVEFINSFPFTETYTTGSMFAYDGGDRIYFTKESTGRVMYFDLLSNQIYNSSTIPYGMGTAVLGNRMEVISTPDNLKYIFMGRHSAQEMFRTLAYW